MDAAGAPGQKRSRLPMMIVLHTLKYGDTSLIVHGYTKEEGRVSFILRGAFRQSSGKRSAPRPEVVSLHSIREDFDKISIAMFISELLYRTLLHSERDEELYDFLEDAVLRLEAFEGSPANFHLWFLARYAAFLGFPFERGFNLDYNPFTPQQTARLRTLHEASFEEAMVMAMTGAERKELIEAVIRWLEYHTGSRIELRSISVLHQLSKIR